MFMSQGKASCGLKAFLYKSEHAMLPSNCTPRKTFPFPLDHHNVLQPKKHANFADKPHLQNPSYVPFAGFWERHPEENQ
jgi:hypothetical protein